LVNPKQSTGRPAGSYLRAVQFMNSDSSHPRLDETQKSAAGWPSLPIRSILALVPYLDDYQERRRLARTYAGMTDDELLHLARHPEALTETAQETLEDELDRRDIEDSEEEFQPREQVELQSLVTIRQFRDLPEALLAKGSLESAGIECFLRDDNLVRLDWFISNFIGGIKLCVKAQDAQSAREILDDPILEGLYVQGVGLYEQPRCPKCHSLDVNFQELDRPIAYLSAFLRVPIPAQRPAWHCHSCDAEWEDEPGIDEGLSS
jgi:hypothetical protein